MHVVFGRAFPRSLRDPRSSLLAIKQRHWRCKSGLTSRVCTVDKDAVRVSFLRPAFEFCCCEPPSCHHCCVFFSRRSLTTPLTTPTPPAPLFKPQDKHPCGPKREQHPPIVPGAEGDGQDAGEPRRRRDHHERRGHHPRQDAGRAPGEETDKTDRQTRQIDRHGGANQRARKGGSEGGEGGREGGSKGGR